MKSRYSSSYKRSRALIIGIGNYSNPQLNDIHGAVKDANSFSGLLSNIIPPFTQKVLINEQANKNTILEELNSLRSSDPEDRILIYFAGHGYYRTDHRGHDEGYIVAFDTDPDKDYTAISIKDVLDLRFHCLSKHIGVILDSCFSGQALGLARGSNTSSIKREKYLTRKAYQVITAGAADQTVSDSSSMTNYLISIINEEIKNNSDLLTFSSLGVALKDKMASAVDKTQLPQFGHLVGSQGGEFIFSAAETYWSLSPETENVFDDSRYDVLDSQNGTYLAEVDLSGRLEQLDKPTVLSLAKGLSYSIIISGMEKQRAIQLITNYKPRWGITRKRVFLYTLLLHNLINDHYQKLDQVIIDIEYPGYEDIIKGTLMNLLGGKEKSGEVSQLKFTRLRRDIPASKMATMIYQGIREADRIVTAEEIFSTIKMR